MLQRTAFAGGDPKTWSFSAWVKRGFTNENPQVLLAAQADANNTMSIALLGNTGANAKPSKNCL